LPSAAAAIAASSAVKGVGAIQQGNAAAGAATYNANVAAQNSQLLTTEANLTGAVGAQNVAASEQATRAKIGATQANQGASGINVNSGSSVDVRKSEAEVGMYNALNIRSQAARQAYGYTTEAAHQMGESALQTSAAKSDKTAGLISAFGDVLGGAGQAAQYVSPGGSGGNTVLTPQARAFLASGGPTSGLTQDTLSSGMGLY
jgi:hypothetical protein